MVLLLLFILNKIRHPTSVPCFSHAYPFLRNIQEFLRNLKKKKNVVLLENMFLWMPLGIPSQNQIYSFIFYYNCQNIAVGIVTKLYIL